VRQSPTHLDKVSFLKGFTSKRLIFLNGLLALVYFTAIAFGFAHGNQVLFGLLIGGEVFHLLQVIGFCYTIWGKPTEKQFDDSFNKSVDIFITVCGEPVEIVRQTALAALAMQYPNFKVYLLNDGYVAKKDNWRAINALALELGIGSVTRRKPGGAKAGNINYGLKKTSSPYFVVFDADHVPHPDFLRQVMGYFVNPNMGFVQTPQFYKNQRLNDITRTAWDQQTLFFGPIMTGKNRMNAAFMCGTNMAVSRKAVLEVGGMCEFNIAEDFLTSLFVHAKGWQSVYVNKVLAEGLAPEDFLSYYKQQYRWTRGSLEVIFRYNPLFMRGLTLPQRLQYLISASYYFSGFVVAIDMIIPLIFLYTGITAINTATMALALVFLPYIFLNLYTLQKSSNFSYSFRAISFSISAFFLQLRAIVAVLTNQQTAFSVTPKSQQQGNFSYLVIPHLLYMVVAAGGLGVGFYRDGLSASLLANASWAAVNIGLFLPFIKAAVPRYVFQLSRKNRSQPMVGQTMGRAAESKT
jgi:cellulose synthase (UDP-forming)